MRNLIAFTQRLYTIICNICIQFILSEKLFILCILSCVLCMILVNDDDDFLFLIYTGIIYLCVERQIFIFKLEHRLLFISIFVKSYSKLYICTLLVLKKKLIKE